MTVIDDKTLDELLADLGSDDQWNLDPGDPMDVRMLLDAARHATSSSKRSDDGSVGDGEATKAKRRGTSQAAEDERWSKNALGKDIDFSVFRNSDDEADGSVEGGSKATRKDAKHDPKREDAEEDEAADEIVRQMLDEVRLEPKTPPRAVSPPPKKSSSPVISAGHEDAEFSLPSAPTALPSPPAESSRKSADFDSDIAARLAALSTNDLGLPSAPKFKPSDNKKKETKAEVKKPGYTDEDIDSWCVICQDDATVRCRGCEGDLYCASCWKEGHIGPDAGMDEKTHKWTKYQKSK